MTAQEMKWAMEFGPDPNVGEWLQYHAYETIVEEDDLSVYTWNIGYSSRYSDGFVEIKTIRVELKAGIVARVTQFKRDEESKIPTRDYLREMAKLEAKRATDTMKQRRNKK